MFKDLPEVVKQMIISYLLADDFSNAKRVYDDWKSKQFIFDSSSESKGI